MRGRVEPHQNPVTTKNASANPARLDRWLWAVRACKTRSVAATACRHGQVTVGGVVAKPARELKPGDEVVMRQGEEQRILIVRDFPISRVGAKLVSDYCEDRSPPRPTRAERIATGELVLARPRGAGRPTKRDRRRLDDLLHSP
jgi:ribosome-associated heat shock protein Hsp15